MNPDIHLESLLALKVDTYTDTKILDILISVLTSSFPELEDEPILELRRDICNAPNTHTLLLTDQNSTGIGVMSLQESETDQHCAEIFNVCIRPCYRGEGFGRRLIQLGEDFGAAVGYKRLSLYAELDVSEFYTDLGFSQRGYLLMIDHIPHAVMSKDIG